MENASPNKKRTCSNGPTLGQFKAWLKALSVTGGRFWSRMARRRSSVSNSGRKKKIEIRIQEGKPRRHQGREVIPIFTEQTTDCWSNNETEPESRPDQTQAPGPVLFVSDI